jgi:hypothetical protein
LEEEEKEINGHKLIMQIDPLKKDNGRGRTINVDIFDIRAASNGLTNFERVTSESTSQKKTKTIKNS